MAQITELTPEQLALIPQIVAEYREKGMKTGHIDRKKAKAYAKRLFAVLKRPPNPKVVFAEGPREAWRIVCEHVAGEKLKKLPDFVWPYLDGQFMTGYVGWIEFWRRIGVELPDTSIIDDSIEFGPIYPLEDMCCIVEHPDILKMKEGRLHADGGPALKYRDGTVCWSLNGVSVPQWVAETPWDKLDASEFAKITNVEVRREFVRKIGIERLCTQLGTEVLDKEGNYELLMVDLKGATGKWPYLKMLNPSIGVWHMECVSKDCKTVKDAIRFRNQTDIPPRVLT